MKRSASGEPKKVKTKKVKTNAPIQEEVVEVLNELLETVNSDVPKNTFEETFIHWKTIDVQRKNLKLLIETFVKSQPISVRAFRTKQFLTMWKSANYKKLFIDLWVNGCIAKKDLNKFEVQIINKMLQICIDLNLRNTLLDKIDDGEDVILGMEKAGNFLWEVFLAK